MSEKLKEILSQNSGQFAAITPFDLNKENVKIFDFTADNHDIKQIDLNNEDAFSGYIFGELEKSGTPVGIGLYNEDRDIYKRSEHFGGSKIRSIHLGIDIWAIAGTPIYAPLDGKIHSFKNNNTHGDYGPTIILEHQLEGITFYTLYGHLSLQSIGNKRIGQQIEKGKHFADFGEYEVNVHWPPHLHFQIISDIGDNFGDFPGVAAKSEKRFYLDICPNPNLILGIERLKS